MRSLLAALLVVAAASVRAQDVIPDGAVVLFAPGSAEVTPAARDIILAFLRPPRPRGFRGHCLDGHADRGAGAEGLALARAEAVAAVMLRQGVDRADIAIAVQGDRAPVRLAVPGVAEPMNDRVAMRPCPGPRLAGDAAAEARALDAAILPGHVAAVSVGIARVLGCAAPELPRWAWEVPPLLCPADLPPDAVPQVTVRRAGRALGVKVVLEWPAGIGGGEAQRRARAAAAVVLDIFGVPPAALLAALPAGEAEITAGGMQAVVEAGPGALRRLRLAPAGAP